jgi:hypothetical protein
MDLGRRGEACSICGDLVIATGGGGRSVCD